MKRIISVYSRAWRVFHGDKELQNGAYFYSREIVKNIIPNVDTSRDWVTINCQVGGLSRPIVFVHSNLNPDKYRWAAKFRDAVFVCSQEETRKAVERYGRAILLPLSIDVAEVEKYRRAKTKDVCFAGRAGKKRFAGRDISEVEYLSGLTRDVFLSRLAEYRRAYCVGRVALEALALGVEVLPYDTRFPDPSVWRLLDNRDAAFMLQKQLDEIDGIDRREIVEDGDYLRLGRY